MNPHLSGSEVKTVCVIDIPQSQRGRPIKSKGTSIFELIAYLATCTREEYAVPVQFARSPISIHPTNGLESPGAIILQFFQLGIRRHSPTVAPDDMGGVVRKVKYETRLLNAIKNNELYLCFQPQYDMKERKLRGFEALCRWNSEKFGEVPPTEFIPVAESVGFIVPLGEWVLESACLAMNRIKEATGWNGVMSVNISAVQLMSPMFMQSVHRIIKKTGIDPKNLEFEVTESVMVSNVDYAVKVLQEVSDMGITVALDDFGTGYSSLNYLRQLPIHVLKIDKSFVDDLPIKNTQRLMVGSIIGLVHQMKIRVIAEGVDDRRQLDILTKYQCDYVQGNIWGRPVMEQEVEALFATKPV